MRAPLVLGRQIVPATTRCPVHLGGLPTPPTSSVEVIAPQVYPARWMPPRRAQSLRPPLPGVGQRAFSKGSIDVGHRTVSCRDPTPSPTRFARRASRVSVGPGRLPSRCESSDTRAWRGSGRTHRIAYRGRPALPADQRFRGVGQDHERIAVAPPAQQSTEIVTRNRPVGRTGQRNLSK